MSRSYWRSAIAAVGIILAGAIHAQPVSDDASGQTRADKTQTKPQTDETPLKLEAIKNAIDGLARAIEAQKDEAEAKRKDTREESDLQAQWQMARWTENAVYVAIGALVLTITGVILIWRTLFHTRRAADFARDMVVEAERSNSAAIAAAQAAQKSADAIPNIERAYLFFWDVERKDFVFSTGPNRTVSFPTEGNTVTYHRTRLPI